MKQRSRLKRWFLTGIVLLAPISVTVYLFAAVVRSMDGMIHLIPPPWQPEALFGFHVPGLGFVLTLLIILLTGMIGASYIGRQMVRMGEAIVTRIPLVRAVYGALKSTMETMVQDNKNAFRQVVLIEYPRRGLHALAFVTGVNDGEIQRRLAGNVVSVFVPTTPNPTSGFLLYVPEDDIIPLDMSVEDGMKCVISAGVVNPE